MSIVDNTKYTIENNILSLNNPLYRGDCYICQFTHRVNRNFQDSNAPTNDRIVDKKTWIDNYKVSDGVVKQEDLEKVNTGDLNAVKLGMWVTFTVRATKNLCVRALDDSVTDEVSVTGHARGFYPYYSRSTAGTYK
jgi:CTP:phosphocholine cytidylyltransferase-like protein